VGIGFSALQVADNLGPLLPAAFVRNQHDNSEFILTLYTQEVLSGSHVSHRACWRWIVSVKAHRCIAQAVVRFIQVP
jgi:hypothetical protein